MWSDGIMRTTCRGLRLIIGDDGRSSLTLDGDHDVRVYANSPDELRHVLETALKLLDEAVAERNGPKDGQD
jgi:hypothetical protein